MLPMGAHWTDVPELLEQHLAGIQARVDQAQPGTWFASPTAAAPDAVCTRHDGYTRTVGQFTNMLPGDLELTLHARSDLSWSLDLIAKLRTRVAELESATGTARAMHRKHPDSEHCQYDDMTWPCPTVTALGDPSEAAELDAMRADHPAPCRVPDSPDCTCPGEPTLPQCGKTVATNGNIYAPCARHAGHSAAYCRDSAHNHYFLAADTSGPTP